MMRQAGRYLPEYRESRKTAGSFLQLCKSAQFATDVTLQPLDRYPLLDAAILFSDILTVPDAMGLGLYFEEGEGPKFERTLQQEADIQKLEVPDMAKLQYVFNAVSSIRKALDGRVPLIGFSGSPWTLATYMVEGGSSKSFQKIKSMMYNEPRLTHQMLDKLAESVALYLNAQIEAGAQAVMLFDTWGGMLSTEDYLEFSLYYAKQVRQLLKTDCDGQKVPTILFTKGGGLWLESMADAGYDALGLDWQTDIAQARVRVGDKVALQGNLDPVALYAEPQVIADKVKTILQKYGNGSGHVFNLGHGILPDMNPEHVKAMVDAVHEFSLPYHQNAM
jgi:uroporphyrinogen decarboxylase